MLYYKSKQTKVKQMFTEAIKAIKTAIKNGQAVTAHQMVGAGLIGMSKADEIYIDGKLAVIISNDLFPYWQHEVKKAKLNTSQIVCLGTALLR
jgi:hypothetical protein